MILDGGIDQIPNHHNKIWNVVESRLVWFVAMMTEVICVMFLLIANESSTLSTVKKRWNLIFDIEVNLLLMAGNIAGNFFRMLGINVVNNLFELMAGPENWWFHPSGIQGMNFSGIDELTGGDVSPQVSSYP